VLSEGRVNETPWTWTLLKQTFLIQNETKERGFLKKLQASEWEKSRVIQDLLFEAKSQCRKTHPKKKYAPYPIELEDPPIKHVNNFDWF